MNDVRMCDRAPDLIWKIREGFPEAVTLVLRCEWEWGINWAKRAGRAMQAEERAYANAQR